MSQDHETVAQTKAASSEASSPDPTEETRDVLDVVAASFGSMYNEYAIQIDQFKDTVGVQDPVGWFPTLAEAMLDFALGKATEKIAALVASRALEFFASGSARESTANLTGPLRTRHARTINTISLPAPKHNFDANGLVSNMLAKGLNVGVAAGKATLREASGAPPLSRFIAANKRAANNATDEDREHFLRHGRHQIKTLQQAEALRHAFAKEAMVEAGREHYERTRDAWISYIAQQQFGEGSNGLTDMRAQEQRDFSNKPINHEGPTAPTPIDGMHGKNNGVLEVWAELPATNGMWMSGEPTVKVAVLAGVNAALRDQYKGRQLAECRVPRQIIATVKGDHADFVVNLDEEGLASRLPTGESQWLRDRATIGHPENLTKDDSEKKSTGLKLLLEDLVLGSVVSKAW
jgi:hypothetical protein